MRKTALAVGAIIVIWAASLLVVEYYWLNQPSQVDTSWIAKINNYVEEAKPYPTPTNENYVLNMYLIYLHENGTDQLINYTSTKTEFVLYLESLISQAHEQPNKLITHVFVWNNVTNADRVVVLQYRFYINAPRQTNSAFFVLDDKLSACLRGLIILQQDDGNPEKWSTWAITK